MRQVARILAAVALVVLGACGAEAEVFVLTNGGRVEGEELVAFAEKQNRILI